MLDRAPRHALVIALRYLGDVLLATPLVHALRERYPDCQIDMVVFEGTQSMLEGNPDVRNVLTLPERADRATLLAMLRRVWRQYDLAVIPQPNDKPHMLGWAAASTRYGLVPEKRGQGWWKRLLLRSPLPGDIPIHRVLENDRIATVMGLGPAHTLVPPTAGMRRQDWLALDGGSQPFDPAMPYAVVHPSPRWRYKQWHAEGWRALILDLAARGLRIVVTGGPGSAETDYLDGILQELPSGIQDTIWRAQGTLSLAQTADLLRGARVYVGPDTATTHLAAACGTPSVALYGPTDPGRWGPWPAGTSTSWEPVAPAQRRANVILLQNAEHACVPCREEGCERSRTSHSACLDTLDSQRVLQAVQGLLDPSAPVA